MSFSLISFLRSLFCKHAWARSSRLEQGQLIPTLRCMKCGRMKDEPPSRLDGGRDSGERGGRRDEDDEHDCGDRF